ncbi:MAG: hypothetical protein V4472_03315 [Pseudomonadota bacterium]
MIPKVEHGVPQCAVLRKWNTDAALPDHRRTRIDRELAALRRGDDSIQDKAAIIVDKVHGGEILREM